MKPFLMSFPRLIYPIELPNKNRDRPLEVLALGISRSGTDSLRQALVELGFDGVYHGNNYGSNLEDPIGWIKLSQAHIQGDKGSLKATDFDKIMGDCAAITDIPAAGFAHELLDAFSEAKVILNYREDVDAWAMSCENTIERVTSLKTWPEISTWFETFFQTALFWRQKSYWYTWSQHFNGDFQRNGRDWYREHYRSLEKRLPAGTYLKWKVEDGWTPLCEFLGKPVPDRPFPSGNVPKQFMERAAKNQEELRGIAVRNMQVVAATVIAVSTMVIAYSRVVF